MDALLPSQDADYSSGPSGAPYVRHHPEQTLLYQIIKQYYPVFIEHLTSSGRTLPRFVHREFEDYLKCGLLEYWFLRVRCEDCHAEKLVAVSCKQRGFCPSCGARRMVESAALLVPFAEKETSDAACIETNGRHGTPTGGNRSDQYRTMDGT